MKHKRRDIREGQLTLDRFMKPRRIGLSFYKKGNMLIDGCMGVPERSMNVTLFLNFAKESGIDVEKGLKWLNSGGLGCFSAGPYSCFDILLLIKAKDLDIDIPKDAIAFNSRTSYFGHSMSNRDTLSWLIRTKELGIDANKEVQSSGLCIQDEFSRLQLLHPFIKSDIDADNSSLRSSGLCIQDEFSRLQLLHPFIKSDIDADNSSLRSSGLCIQDEFSRLQLLHPFIKSDIDADNNNWPKTGNTTLATTVSVFDDSERLAPFRPQHELMDLKLKEEELEIKKKNASNTVRFGYIQTAMNIIHMLLPFI